MPRNQVELLGLLMEEAYRPLRRRLEGLTEEELWWEPVPGPGRSTASRTGA